MPDLITSPSNPAVTRVRGLLSRRDRREAERAFVAEGARAIGDAIAAGFPPSLVLLREGTPPPPGLAPDADIRVLAARLFDGLSDVATPQGLLAVLPMPDLPDPPGAAPLVLVADRLRDPGNLGALLRAAAGAGATAAALTPGTVDPFNPKTVRAGMGAHWRIPIRRLPEGAPAIGALAPLVVAAAADASLPYDGVDYRGPAAIVIGSEAHGLSRDAAAAATVTVAIPLAAEVESLNAAAAGTVILFEAARQRRTRS
ncbi:MAG: TrmH family RNA methyltransferase [Chloroflexota bacterium]